MCSRLLLELGRLLTVEIGDYNGLTYFGPNSVINCHIFVEI